MRLFENLFSKVDYNQEVTGLTLELKCLYLLDLFSHVDRNILVVTSSLYEANQFYQVLSNYTEHVFLFPMDDFLTSEALAVSPELKVSRLETLNSICNGGKCFIITNLMGFLRFLPNKKEYMESFLELSTGMSIDISTLNEKLYRMGYVKDTIVSKTGEYASRGFVVDIFPIGVENPIRVEFWGDEIESIKFFDIDSQFTMKSVGRVCLYPNTEFIVSSKEDVAEKKQRELVFYTEPVSIFDYLDNPITCFYDYSQLCSSYQSLQQEIFQYNLGIGNDCNILYMHPMDKISVLDVLYLNNFDTVIGTNLPVISYSSKEIDMFTGNSQDIKNRLLGYLNLGKYVIVCVESRYQVNKIMDEFSSDQFIFTNEFEIFPDLINVVIKKMTYGFEFENYIVITERELFRKESVHIKYKSNFKLGTKIRNIHKLSVGDYVVHVMNGIGRYCGIKTLSKNGFLKDYINIEYRDGDHLYVPVEKIEYVNKYSANDGIVPKLNKLGGTEWQKTKLKAKKRIENIAEDLLKLYASREATVGFAYPEDDELQLEFEKRFPYTETVDQLRAVEDIKKDMQRTQPMDRLLCGDVGFGKTEVAFRAMFKAVQAGKQVALLCPTTILSNQHYKNAIERFADFPVKICLLNRFVSFKDMKRNIEDIKTGKADIVIGTHRLLGKDIEFFDLGLLVIDEEQRFGVKHKEKIKKYKNTVDVLTLSATPIPRTLQLSMGGIRGLSLIETPPVNRYPVQTYVLAFNNQIVKDAIYKELSRKGQIFILYNHIDDMDLKQKEIQKIVPDARIVSIHGRMTKDEIESRMMDFINHEYDILLCTTIIETGIDMPNVNTLLILDADHFGLSQLYQIRGRVGRSNRIAYCYLMYDGGKSLSDVAIKRLNVIKDFTELGSGFAIAMRDLSIRGAGDILGSEQAGFVDSVGMELFLNMLNEEIEKLKGGKVEKESFENKESLKKEDSALLNVETTIPESYVAEESLRIDIHKKINEIDSLDKLEQIKKELTDRFGPIPNTILIYMHEEWFEKLAQQLGIEQVRQTVNFVEIVIPQDLVMQINCEDLFIEVTKISRFFRFGMRDHSLLITLDIIHLDDHFVYYLISLLQLILKLKKEA